MPTVLIALHQPILRALALRFRISNPAPSDALVLMLGGDDDRPRKTAELFHQGYAPVIIMCSDPDTRMNRRTLLANGVPDEAIQVLGLIHDTREEALRVRAFAQEHRLRRVTLVTTSYHTARCHWMFCRVFRDSGIEVRAAASEAASFNEANWYKTAHGRVAYVREALKFAYYRMNY